MIKLFVILIVIFLLVCIGTVFLKESKKLNKTTGNSQKVNKDLIFWTGVSAATLMSILGVIAIIPFLF